MITLFIILIIIAFVIGSPLFAIMLFLTALGIYEVLTLDPAARDPVGGLRKYTAK